MPRFVARDRELLTGQVGLDAVVATIPLTVQTKGIFFSDLVDTLPRRSWDALVPSLSVPPRLGRYLPFSSYPVRDLMRLLGVVARERHPTVGSREAFRRVGRQGFDAFCKTTVGRVIMAALGDPMSAAKKYPEAYRLMSNAAEITGEQLGPAHAQLIFAGYHGACEYDLGFIEAAVMHFGSTPVVTMDQRPDALIVDVAW